MTKKIGKNDPCPCGSGKKYNKCCGQAAEALPIPDRRLMERDMAAMQRRLNAQTFQSADEVNAYLRDMEAKGDIPKWRPESPLDRAQELVYQALETTGPKKRLRLALEAIKISRDCADAYVLLAGEFAETLEQQRDWYQQGVEAGERALGPEAFVKDVGHFWGYVEARPYMRAREGLAQCLWLLGEDEAAIEQYREMLRLNPNDNQGIRYKLLSCLMQRSDIDAAEKLLTDYGTEPTPDWLFTRALVTFLRQGDSAKARQWLTKAVKQNPHVVPYLLRQRRLPRTLPDSVELGGEDEAASYVSEFRAVWSKYRRAKKWVESQTSDVSEKKSG